MSRTYKDKKWKLRYPENDYKFGIERVPYTVEYISIYTDEKCSYTSYWLKDIPGAKTKKPRHEHGDWNWCHSTPSWWVREFMTAPKRAKCRNWEKTRTLDNLDETCPDYGRKPHIYYW